MNFLSYVAENYQYILSLAFAHIKLTFIAVLLAIMIGVPLGILINTYKSLSKGIIGIINLIQAIPSLALLGLFIPLLGIGVLPAIAVVILYSLLPIVKNTYTGLNAINPQTLEASKGIGMTRLQRLFKVKLPLALPIIMAGIRISSVTAVGLMTVAAFIGAGGLGSLIFAGIQTVNYNKILAGAIPACILALAIDFFVGKIEYFVTPLPLRKGKTVISEQTIAKNKRIRKYGLISIILLAFIIAGTIFYTTMENKKKITVGSKSFSEQVILGNMVSDIIEEHTDLKVDRKLRLGSTQITFTGITNAEIDVYVEYTGTALVNILQLPSSSDTDYAYNTVKSEFDKRYGLKLLKPLGFNNTYTIATTKEIKEKYNLNKISDLKAVSKEFTLSPTIEFSNRPDGLPGFLKAYDMEFKAVNPVEGALRYSAIESGKSQVIDAFSTDGLLKAFELEVLEDDMHFFPPYYAVPIVRKEILEKYPQLEEAINKLAGQIDDKTMRELNYKVDKLGMEPDKVAREFLIERGFIKEK